MYVHYLAACMCLTVLLSAFQPQLAAALPLCKIPCSALLSTRLHALLKRFWFLWPSAVVAHACSFSAHTSSSSDLWVRAQEVIFLGKFT